MPFMDYPFLATQIHPFVAHQALEDEVQDPFVRVISQLDNLIRDLPAVVPEPLPMIYAPPWRRRVRLDIADYPEIKQIKKFRFTVAEIEDIALRLGLPPYVGDRTKAGMPRRDALALVMHRLAKPRTLDDSSDVFGLNESILSTVFNLTVQQIYSNWKHLLLFDHVRLTPQYLMTLAAAVAAKGAPLQNCWVFLDGTHMQIARPSLHQDRYYSGHKRIHSLKYQCVATPDGMTVHMSGPYRGRQHDASILTDSKLRDYLAQHSVDMYGNPMVIYGDEGYARRGQVLSPYRARRLTIEQGQFNEGMRRPRLCVEWGFASISNHWRFVKYPPNLRIRLSPVGIYYPVATLLNNIQFCYGRKKSTHGYYNNIPSPTIDEYLTPRAIWDETRVVMTAHASFTEPWQ